MNPAELENSSLGEYREIEITFHRDLMNVCRKYMNQLGIASMVGIIDIVKRETIDLEAATKENIRNEEPKNLAEPDTDFFQ